MEVSSCMSLVKKIYQPQGIALPGGVLKIKSDKDRLWGQSPLSPVRPAMKTYTASLCIFWKMWKHFAWRGVRVSRLRPSVPHRVWEGPVWVHVCVYDLFFWSAFVCIRCVACVFWCLCAFAHQILIVWIFILCISSTVCLCTTLTLTCM